MGSKKNQNRWAKIWRSQLRLLYKTCDILNLEFAQVSVDPLGFCWPGGWPVESEDLPKGLADIGPRLLRYNSICIIYAPYVNIESIIVYIYNYICKLSLCHYQLHVYVSLCLSSSWIPLSLDVQFRCPSLGLSSVWKGPGIDSPSWWSYTMPLKVQREVVKFMAGLVGLDGPDFRWTRGNSTHPET